MFTDRVIATLVILRFQLPHAARAVFYAVDRSAITRAVHEVRPLPPARGFAVPVDPGVRLRTLADVFACPASEGVRLRIDGTGVQVRRPAAGRRAFVSGKKKHDTIKATVLSDGGGRPLRAGAFRPGRMHDVTALRTEGIEDLLRARPDITAEVDSGHRGLAGPGPRLPRPGQRPTQETRQGLPARSNRPLGTATPPAVLGADRRRARLRRTQAVAGLPHWTGRREYFQETALAIAGLVFDRAATR